VQGSNLHWNRYDCPETLAKFSAFAECFICDRGNYLLANRDSIIVNRCSKSGNHREKDGAASEDLRRCRHSPGAYGGYLPHRGRTRGSPNAGATGNHRHSATRQKKRKFRITWVQQLAPSEVRTGVEALEPQDNFWGVDFSDQGHSDKKDVQAFLSFLSDSSHTRLKRETLASVLKK
jgi:hypothetical protein